MPDRRIVALRRLFAATGVVLAALWLLEISGLLDARGLARIVTLAAVTAGAALLVASVRRLLLMPAGAERSRALALAGLLLIAFVLRVTGLDFELMDEPIGDEGVFHEVSQRINAGHPFPETFNYGHLLYYLGAFAIWFYDLFPRTVTWILELFYTTHEGYGVQRILLLGVNAVLSALAVGAAFGAAYRVAQRAGEESEARSEGAGPLPAAVFAGALLAFSPLYNGIAHQLIADVPAAAFAAFSLYFVSRLLEREALEDYLLAGAAAGLAAASKYPGGVVAVAIFGIWAYWRIRSRAWSWSLMWAALAAIASMVASMPGLLVRFDDAFRGEGLDIFFGFRQYARGGWIGVQPESNLAWYGRELVSSFGWPALALGAVGVPFLARAQRRRWLLMAIYPAVYLTLIFSMTMVVRRNLQAVMPALAVLLGVGLAAVGARLGGRRAAAAVAVLALAYPAWATVTWAVSHTRPGTRQIALDWINENVPEGASLIGERYGPDLDEERYEFVKRRFAAWVDFDEMISGKWDFVILAHPSYGRFLETKTFRREHQEELKERYLRMLELPKVAEFAPSALTTGPLLSVHALQPPEPRFLEERLFLPDEATFISHHSLRRDGPGKPLQYTMRWQFAVFKDFFAAGRYRVELGMNPPPEQGYLHVVDRHNREVGTFDLRGDLEISLPKDEKYLLRVFITPPTRLYGVKVSPLSGTG